MTSTLKNTILSAGSMLLLGAGAARADASELMNVSVPFPFVVEHKTLPAGQYLVERDDMDPSVLVILGTNGTRGEAVVLTEGAGGQDPEGNKACLSFSRTGNEYHLAKIWESRSEGREVIAQE